MERPFGYDNVVKAINHRKEAVTEEEINKYTPYLKFREGIGGPYDVNKQDKIDTVKKIGLNKALIGMDKWTVMRGFNAATYYIEEKYGYKRHTAENMKLAAAVMGTDDI